MNATPNRAARRRHARPQKSRLVPKPVLCATFLPGCGNCGAPHPLALKPVPLDVTKCADCGAGVAGPAPTVEVPAVLIGWHPATLLARLSLWVGETLLKIAKGL